MDRLALARGAMAVAAAAAAGGWAAARRPDLARGLTVLVFAGVALVAVGIAVRRVGGVSCGAVCLSAAFLLGDAGKAVEVGEPAVFGVLVYAVLELAWASIGLAAPTTVDPVVVRARRTTVAVAASSGAALALVAGVVAEAARGAGPVLLVGGIAAAVALVWTMTVVATGAGRAYRGGASR